MANEYFTAIIGITLWTFLGARYAMRSTGNFAWHKLFMAGPLVWLLFFVLFIVTVTKDEKDD